MSEPNSTAHGKRNNDTPRKLAIIASKGSLDMAYPPLILANSARMSEVECDIFFTFWGLDLVTKKKVGRIKLAVLGNPAYSLAPFAAWARIPSLLGIVPGMSGLATWMMKRQIAKLDYPPVPDFIKIVQQEGVRLFGCLMSMDLMGLEEDDLIDGVEVMGAMEFMEMTNGAQLLFI
jgi:peroxiredoxin family protein